MQSYTTARIYITTIITTIKQRLDKATFLY
jgi:hypothetical protein